MNTTPGHLTSTAPRRRISTFNLLYLTVLTVGGLWCLVVGVWTMGVVLVGMAVVLGIVIGRSRRGAGTDTGRVDAVQPYDERERAASTWAFAVVGQAALIGLTAVFVGLVATDTGPGLLPVALGLVALAVVWGVANRVAVRRS
ncbi:hypothetical protein [Phycicoccus flavus]|uniref:Uncharacterized protein n=1 Tax=Phycicoccus flavus TaxID=2502783 RepID=A0A8T6R5B1_9MICO|nr:hypothetical protein [Phycicoccus flavus]NHA69669.1 hypothetical protein [Phycicoccus flavus]